MELVTSKANLLKSLQLASGVADKRHTLPILSYLLVQVESGRLYLTGSDLEVELVGITHVDKTHPAMKFTLPAKKFLDICRSLSDAHPIHIYPSENRVVVKSGRNRFTLSSLPIADFPNIGSQPGEAEFTVPQDKLKQLIDKVAFAMAQQDVRYYLNGLLLNVSEQRLAAVGTDGHRLAYAEVELGTVQLPALAVIVPRKAVMELGKLLLDQACPVTVVVDKQLISLTGQDFIFTSKLIEGKFPDYARVFPKQSAYTILAERERLKHAVSTASILSNEKHRAVRFSFEHSLLKISANNPEQEEAEVDMPVSYSGEPFEVGFNAGYLIDVLNAIDSLEVRLTLADQRSSVLFEGADKRISRYIIMPLQI